MSGLTEQWFAELRRATSAVISASSSGSYEEFYRARDNFRAAMNWNAAHVLLNEIERLQREAKYYSKSAAEWRSKAQDAEREIERLRQELDETERERVRFTDLYVEARSEIGDLRRERETLLADLCEIDRLAKRWNGGFGPNFPPAGLSSEDFLAITGRYFDRRGRMRKSLLAADTAHTTTYRQIAECSDGWECTAPDCTTAWTLPDGGPSHHRMRFCPGCGRRIVGEEHWRVDEDGGTS